MLLLILLATSLHGKAQITFGLWSNNYIELTSYLGKSTHAQFNTFQFQMGSQSNINIPNWSLSVRLLRPIQPSSGGPNKSGKPFPADKISLRWTEDDNQPHLNLNAIGASRNDIFLANSSEVFLIERSNQPLRAEKNDYSSALLFGMVKIAQGKYLEDFVSGVSGDTRIVYDIPLQFTLYEVNSKVIGTQFLNYKLHILPKLTDGGAVEVVPDYSLQVDAGAMDASLQFFTRQHYTDGVKLLVENAIRINSNTDYELRVKSLDAEIARPAGEGLPLSLLSLQVIPSMGGGGTVTNPRIQLSTAEQVVYSGQSKDKNINRVFNIQYEANLTRAQSLTARPGNYTVSLLYLLMPK
ncbi:hypothetical protein [Sphingobacterium faecale]|uniref:Uncharacterized protein n=1 Tax=Sphingobacterium faecale TaxID=2803775 RepID=A0ABS1R6Y9_9SPHI|nr:hypothetical protein [Sphingobacterium faecale]MBL1410477.1 hypothetical protein [Sphingobacterium faecale]